MPRPAQKPEPNALEADARKALEKQARWPLTDEEWAQAKHDLLTLFHLLRGWSHPVAPSTEPPEPRPVLSLAIPVGSG